MHHATDVPVDGWLGTSLQNPNFSTHKYGSGFEVRNNAGVGKIKVNNPRWEWARGLRGVVGTLVVGGLLDGAFQVISDLVSGLCLSPHQFFWRGMVALGFGLVGAAVGLLVGGAATIVFGSAALVGGIAIAGVFAFGASLTFVIATHNAKSDVLKWITKEMDW